MKTLDWAKVLATSTGDGPLHLMWIEELPRDVLERSIMDAMRNLGVKEVRVAHAEGAALEPAVMTVDLQAAESLDMAAIEAHIRQGRFVRLLAVPTQRVDLG